jgi:hypothetical protein
MSDTKLKTAREVEGYVRKGGANTSFQVLDRPPPPPPIPAKRPAAGDASGKKT